MIIFFVISFLKTRIYTLISMKKYEDALTSMKKCIRIVYLPVNLSLILKLCKLLYYHFFKCFR